MTERIISRQEAEEYNASEIEALRRDFKTDTAALAGADLMAVIVGPWQDWCFSHKSRDMLEAAPQVFASMLSELVHNSVDKDKVKLVLRLIGRVMDECMAKLAESADEIDSASTVVIRKNNG
jgi:hypothetical protein